MAGGETRSALDDRQDVIELYAASVAGPPGREDFWILKIAHAPSDKNLSKKWFCP
jgi:hypothetical protein